MYGICMCFTISTRTPSNSFVCKTYIVYMKCNAVYLEPPSNEWIATWLIILNEKSQNHRKKKKKNEQKSQRWYMVAERGDPRSELIHRHCISAVWDYTLFGIASSCAWEVAFMYILNSCGCDRHDHSQSHTMPEQMHIRVCMNKKRYTIHVCILFIQSNTSIGNRSWSELLREWVNHPVRRRFKEIGSLHWINTTYK